MYIGACQSGSHAMLGMAGQTKAGMTVLPTARLMLVSLSGLDLSFFASNILGLLGKHPLYWPSISSTCCISSSIIRGERIDNMLCKITCVKSCATHVQIYIHSTGVNKQNLNFDN